MSRRSHHQEMMFFDDQTGRSGQWRTWPRYKKRRDPSEPFRISLCPCHFQQVQGNVRRQFHETYPAAWLSAEGDGGGRKQAWNIVTMATSLLVQSGSVVLPFEYTLIYPPSGAAWAMDRFIPSSRQPQHWSRNYHGSQERRRSIGQRRGSPDSQEKDASSYSQGVTLRAEDLLVDSEGKLGSGRRISPANHITPRPGDGRRALLSAQVPPQGVGRPPVVRRSSEGAHRRIKKSSSSSSSSNAADDPTDPSSSSSSSSCNSSSPSSSSESGCNADSETCNYCRLSESSEARESTSGSTDDERSSSPTPSPRLKIGGECRRLTRALSEDCSPPSKPIRRTSPGEYLRHKRDQMERLRCEPTRRHQRPCFLQRCDSDPRLTSSYRTTVSPCRRTLNFASPTRNRVRRKKTEGSPHEEIDNSHLPSAQQLTGKKQTVDMTIEKVTSSIPSTNLPSAQRTNSKMAEDKPVDKVVSTDSAAVDTDQRPRRSALAKNISPIDRVVLAVPSTESPTVQPADTDNRPRRSALAKNISPIDKVILPVPSTPIDKGMLPAPPTDSRTVQPVDTDNRPKRSALAKNISERRSRSKERRSSTHWSNDESTPFLTRRTSFRCAICDCDIPFTNCVLCNAEAKGAFDSTSEIFVNEADLVSLTSEELLVMEGEQVVRKQVEQTLEAAVKTEKKELEEFYDGPTPVEPPPLPAVQSTPDERRTQWTSKSAGHKSLNHDEEEHRSSSSSSVRRSSLRKYNSEPVPETADFQCSKERSEISKDGSTTPSSSKCESRAGYHVAKDSPRKDPPQQREENQSCRVCGQTGEDEERSKSTSEQNQKMKSPAYLKPQFNFEPEIIHKANPVIDEADVDVLPGAVGAFRRLSEEEFISTLNIHDAAKKGDLHVVKLLTKKDPKQMETVDERGWTPIHLAAAHGHTEVVKFLAMEGAHLAALDPSSYTAIHLAAMNGHNPVLEVLLPMGVDVDSVTSEGFTALHLAVMNCHSECIQTLLQWGASLEKRDALGRSINDMVEEYNLQEVALLLRRFHKQLHNFKHMLDIMNREGKTTAEMPREFMDILASIAEESGTD